jgi:hypothetical protein
MNREVDTNFHPIGSSRQTSAQSPEAGVYPDTLDGQMTRLDRAVASTLAERKLLICALYEVLGYLDDRADVVDGDDGRQDANTEMTLAMTLRETLRRVGG